MHGTWEKWWTKILQVAAGGFFHLGIICYSGAARIVMRTASLWLSHLTVSVVCALSCVGSCTSVPQASVSWLRWHHSLLQTQEVRKDLVQTPTVLQGHNCTCEMAIPYLWHCGSYIAGLKLSKNSYTEGLKWLNLREWKVKRKREGERDREDQRSIFHPKGIGVAFTSYVPAISSAYLPTLPLNSCRPEWSCTHIAILNKHAGKMQKHTSSCRFWDV